MNVTDEYAKELERFKKLEKDSKASAKAQEKKEEAQNEAVNEG